MRGIARFSSATSIYSFVFSLIPDFIFQFQVPPFINISRPVPVKKVLLPNFFLVKKFSFLINATLAVEGRGFFFFLNQALY